MTTTLRAAIAALSLLATTSAHAEAEGNGEPFPFRVPGTTVASPRSYAADTGSAAYPEVAGRPSWVALAGGPDGMPASGSEGTVQTANSLPPGALGSPAAYAQGWLMQRYLAQQAIGRTQIAQPAQVPGGRLGG